MKDEQKGTTLKDKQLSLFVYFLWLKAPDVHAAVMCVFVLVKTKSRRGTHVFFV